MSDPVQTVSNGFDALEARVSAAIEAQRTTTAQRAQKHAQDARRRQHRAKFAAVPVALIPHAIAIVEPERVSRWEAAQEQLAG